jgi:hypothetical protein
MGDRPGERGDQGGTSTPASSRHCADIRAICDLALSFGRGFLRGHMQKELLPVAKLLGCIAV